MFDFLFNPHGRVSRAQMWLLYFLPLLAISVVAAIVDGGAALTAAMSGGDVMGAMEAAPAFGLSSIVNLFYLWPSIAVPVKRFHDRGMSGWWVLWFVLFALGGGVFAFMGMPVMIAGGEPGPMVLLGVLIVLVSVIAQFVILYLLPGTAGDNVYGPDPRGSSGARQVRVETASEGGASNWAERLSSDSALKDAADGADAAPVSQAQRRASMRARRASIAPDGRPAFGRRGL